MSTSAPWFNSKGFNSKGFNSKGFNSKGFDSKGFDSSRPNRKNAGFTLVELLVSMAIFGILMGIVLTTFSTGLKVNQREGLYLDVQQNLRNAMQQISQDLRASSQLHLWHATSGCTSLATICSNSDEVSIVTLDGTRTTIPDPPGKSFPKSSETWVCDARSFSEGDVGLLYNGGAVDLFEVTQVQQQRDYTKPCQDKPPNRDKLQHNKDKLSSVWTADAYIFRAVLVNYSLQPDPVDASKKVLYRRTGLSAVGGGSGVMAFDISGLKFTYGIPVNPANTNDQLNFYDTLEAAASALKPFNAAYTADPNAAGLYVGKVVRAVRVTLTGTTQAKARDDAGPKDFTLTETVDFRR